MKNRKRDCSNHCFTFSLVDQREQLLWKLFMQHPDVQKGLRKLGFSSPHLAQ